MSASDLAIHAAATRPPAPIPNETPLGSLAFLIRFWQNPLATWTRHNFEWPITQADGVMGRIAVVCDPAAIRRVFIDNVANYRKDALQLRVLAPGLGRGLLTADGDEWRKQRRALAALFTPRVVEAFAPAMIASAQWLIERWSPLRDGRRVDVAPEMSLATLEVLRRT
ncbi:MAG TPA: cytochrome P450, partial [Roseiarcus sp.]|nr:cytochrome P450 [Roseiarcus sp.]